MISHLTAPNSRCCTEAMTELPILPGNTLSSSWASRVSTRKLQKCCSHSYFFWCKKQRLCPSTARKGECLTYKVTDRQDPLGWSKALWTIDFSKWRDKEVTVSNRSRFFINFWGLQFHYKSYVTTVKEEFPSYLSIHHQPWSIQYHVL